MENVNLPEDSENRHDEFFDSCASFLMDSCSDLDVNVREFLNVDLDLVQSLKDSYGVLFSVLPSMHNVPNFSGPTGTKLGVLLLEWPEDDIPSAKEDIIIARMYFLALLKDFEVNESKKKLKQVIIRNCIDAMTSKEGVEIPKQFIISLSSEDREYLEENRNPEFHQDMDELASKVLAQLSPGETREDGDSHPRFVKKKREDLEARLSTIINNDEQHLNELLNFLNQNPSMKIDGFIDELLG